MVRGSGGRFRKNLIRLLAINNKQKDCFCWQFLMKTAVGKKYYLEFARIRCEKAFWLSERRDDWMQFFLSAGMIFDGLLPMKGALFELRNYFFLGHVTLGEKKEKAIAHCLRTIKANVYLYD